MFDKKYGNKGINMNDKNNNNPLASPSAGAPALNYGDVNTVTPSPGEVKGIIMEKSKNKKNK